MIVIVDFLNISARLARPNRFDCSSVRKKRLKELRIQYLYALNAESEIESGSGDNNSIISCNTLFQEGRT